MVGILRYEDVGIEFKGGSTYAPFGQVLFRAAIVQVYDEEAKDFSCEQVQKVIDKIQKLWHGDPDGGLECKRRRPVSW